MPSKLLRGVRSAQASLASLAVLLAVTACDRAPTSTPATPPTAAVPAAPSTPRVTDAWLGRWTGPEGTFVELTPQPAGAGYRVTIQSLDGPATYDGRAVEGGIAFERAGQTETLRATGMKWLLEKKNCLTVRTGEGFCRN